MDLPQNSPQTGTEEKGLFSTANSVPKGVPRQFGLLALGVAVPIWIGSSRKRVSRKDLWLQDERLPGPLGDRMIRADLGRHVFRLPFPGWRKMGSGAK